MQFFHFGTGNQLIQQINSGYCMQYSDSVEQVFVAHDSITQSNHSNYSAILSCTPNGATTALADFALTWGSIEIAGTTYWGFYRYLSSPYTQIAGPMACNLVVSNLTQVIVSQTFSIMVNASSSSTDWSESITQAQWKELMNYVSGLKIPNLGTVNFVLGTSGSIIDNYYGSANAGAYYFTDSSGNSYLLAVGYSRTVTTQTLYYKLAGNSVFVGAQRTYDSGATTPEWSAWSQYTGYLPLTGGTMLGAVNFGYYASTWSNGTDTSTMTPGGLAFSQGAHLTQYERTEIYIDENLLRFPALTDDETIATESYVDSAVAVETARAETAEQTNAAAIAQEITDRSSAVSAEALARENGDSATLASAQSYADSKVSSVYKPKGSVPTYADLPSNPSAGDVYNVIAAYGNIPAGTNFVWNGTAWDALGGTVDLSVYVPASRTVNGHALTSDVTVTKADILGAYGGTQVTDLNAIVFSGFYTCLGTATGVPNSSSSWYVTHVNSNTGAAEATQTAVSFGTMAIYYRVKTASTWGTWVQETYKTAFNNAVASLDTIVIKGVPYKTVPCGNASGVRSTASGIGSTASGTNSTASGGYSTASENGSTASGYNSTASGYNSTASGYNSTASGYNSAASGSFSTASGSFSTASGTNSTASGSFSIAIGFRAISKILRWVSFDGNNSANGEPQNNYIASFSPDYVLFRNADVDYNATATSAYPNLRKLTDYLGVGAPTIVTETSANILAGTSPYFDVTGAGTSGSPYIVTPKTTLSQPHAHRVYQITMSTPTADTYIHFKGSGTETCMVEITSTVSAATYSYFVNFYDLYNHVRSRNRLNAGTLVATDIDSKTSNAEIYVDLNGYGMYTTNAI